MPAINARNVEVDELLMEIDVVAIKIVRESDGIEQLLGYVARRAAPDFDATYENTKPGLRFVAQPCRVSVDGGLWPGGKFLGADFGPEGTLRLVWADVDWNGNVDMMKLTADDSKAVWPHITNIEPADRRRAAKKSLRHIADDYRRACGK